MNWCTLFRGAVVVLSLHPGAGLVGIAGNVANATEPQEASASPDKAKDTLQLALGDCTWDKLHTEKRQVEAPKALSGPIRDSRDYPREEAIQGHQALLLVHLLVDSHGNVRFPHVVHVFPVNADDAFIDAAVRLVRRNVYSPMKIDGRATASWVPYPVKFGLKGPLLDEAAWSALLKKAHEGDAASTMEVTYSANLLGTMSRLDDALLIDSALHGEHSARFEILKRLSTCHRDSVVDEWIFADANAGSTEAQLWWASLLIKSNDGESLSKAHELLDKVAASNDSFMRLWAGGILATSPQDAVRDPAAALSVASELNHKVSAIYSRDPDYAELLAAAQAANGHYAEAVQSEHRAIEYATALNWNITDLQSRLESYAANKAWRGYLCDCEQLVPGREEYASGGIKHPLPALPSIP